MGCVSRLQDRDLGSWVCVRGDIVCNKFQTSSRCCAATLLLQPLTMLLQCRRTKVAIPNAALQTSICSPRRQMRQHRPARVPRSGLPARASALACIAQTSGFQVTFLLFLLFPSVLPGVNAHYPDVSAAAASSRTPDVKCRSHTVFDGDSRKTVLPSWRGRHHDDPEIHSNGRVKGRCEDETLGPVGPFFWN